MNLVPANAQTTLVSADVLLSLFPQYDEEKHVIMSAPRPLCGFVSIESMDYFIHGRHFALIDMELAGEAVVESNLQMDGTILIPVTDREIIGVYMVGAPYRFRDLAEAKVTQMLHEGMTPKQIAKSSFVTTALEKWTRATHAQCKDVIGQLRHYNFARLGL